MMIKVIIGAVLVIILSGAGYEYRSQLIEQGRQECAAAVETARKDLEGQAQALIEEHAAADKARIAELEQQKAELEQKHQTRDEARQATPVSEHCRQCVITRSWLRGETGGKK